MERVSVIISSYNQIGDLKNAIESVLVQTYRPFEIIVCDDASSDGSKDLIKIYERTYPGLIRGILHEGNLGISQNRNSGIKAAKGDFVTWLDGDDIFNARKLEAELQKFRSDSKVKWVYSQVIEKNEIKNYSKLRFKKSLEGRIFREILPMLGFAPRNPLVAAEVFRKIGFFDENMKLYEDFELCMKLAKFFKCAYCPQPLIVYRVHAAGLHNAEIDKHVANLSKIRSSLLELLKTEPTKARSSMERKLVYGTHFLSMIIKSELNKGRSLNAILLFLKGFIYNPSFLLDYYSILKFIRIFLYESISRFFRKGAFVNHE